MKAYTIENESNNITLYATRQEAELAPGAELFTSVDEFEELAANWPTSRLIEIWNGLPGVTPVNKFKDRKTALTRIWNAIQSFSEEAQTYVEPQIAEETLTISEEAVPEPADSGQQADTGELAPVIAPVEDVLAKKATRSKKAHTGEPRAKTTRDGSKTATVVELMKREGGVTLKAIMEATNWQAHSVRGFISGTLTKKLGLSVISTKGENGERTYTIAS
jgi:Protein of unknown function (DUF3489)